MSLTLLGHRNLKLDPHTPLGNQKRCYNPTYYEIKNYAVTTHTHTVYPLLPKTLRNKSTFEAKT